MFLDKLLSGFKSSIWSNVHVNLDKIRKSLKFFRTVEHQMYVLSTFNCNETRDTRFE